MTDLERIREITGLYLKHGWSLRRVLTRPDLKAGLLADPAVLPLATQLVDAEVNAIWFSRVAAGDREAWELRLVSDLAYALFETFEGDESGEDREDVLREMESRMRDYAAR